MLTRRALFGAVCGAVTAVFLIIGDPAPAAAQTEQEARAFMERLADKAISSIAGAKLSETERLARFRELFSSSFDLPEIGKFVLGRHWRNATEQQRTEFLKLFEEYTVLTWARRFKEYSGETLKISNVTKEGDSGVLVETRIERAQGGNPIPVNWRLRKPDGEFKVVDIVVEGVSLAITNRSDMTAVVQSNGGQIDGLLNALRQKVTQLRANVAER
jgi:phospholipid transport system substrate-binding protein